MRSGHSSAEILLLFTVILLGIVLVLYLQIDTFETEVKAIANEVQRRWFPE